MIPDAPILPKFVVESRIFYFDFSKKTEFSKNNDTISTAVITILEGDNMLVIGAPSINNGLFQVSARYSVGTSGTPYTISCIVTTAQGNTIEGVGVLQVN
jgi:hypothetical protein